MNITIDTSALIELERKTPGAHQQFRKIQDEEISIATPVRTEFLTGVMQSNVAKNVHHAQKILNSYETINFNNTAATIAAQLLTEQRMQGKYKVIFDTLILACAIAQNTDIRIAENKKDFESEHYKGQVLSLANL